MSGFDQLEAQLLRSVREEASHAARVPRATHASLTRSGTAATPTATVAAAHEARARSRWRPRGSRGTSLTVLAAFIASGTAVAAALSITGQPSRALNGSVVRPADPKWKIAAGNDRYRISLAPKLRAGQAGWCTQISLVRAPGERLGGRGCGPVGEAGNPLVSGGSAGYTIYDQRKPGNTDVSGRSFTVHVYTARVAAIRRRDGSVVRTAADPSLPNGMRSVVIVETEPAFDATMLDAAGRVIPARERYAHDQRRRAVEAFDPVGAASTAGSGRCSLALAPPTGVTVDEAVRMRRAPTGFKVQAGSLLACASLKVRAVSGAPYRVALLVGAVDPTAPAPELPSVEPVAGDPELVASPKGLGSTNLTARRVGGAWLVVEGSSPTMRRSILDGVTALR